MKRSKGYLRICMRVLQGSFRCWLICLITRSEEHTSELQSRQYLVCRLLLEKKLIMLLFNGAGTLRYFQARISVSRKSPILNSIHANNSYAFLCLITKCVSRTASYRCTRLG